MKNNRIALYILAAFVLASAYGMVYAIPSAQANERRATAGTNVQGVIATDTIWGLAGSPYNLTGDIQITTSVTLTIESGVTVNGSGNVIETAGNFRVDGNELSKAMLNDVVISQSLHSSYNPSPFININFAVINRGGIYAPGDYAIGVGSFTLRDSHLIDVADPIYLQYPFSDAYIERNIFYRSGGILAARFDSVKIYIRNNLFLEQAGLPGKAFAIKNSTFKADEFIVEFNSFLSNDRWALYLEPYYPGAGMTAINNYWGSVGADEIYTIVHDRLYDTNVATFINVKPVLSSPHPDTPLLAALTPVPILTGTPTFTPNATQTVTVTPTSSPTVTATPNSTPPPTTTTTPSSTNTATPTVFLPVIFH